MLRGFPSHLRKALSKVRTPAELSAVQQLNEYMVGVVQQMEDELGDMQWKQQEKLRKLCDAAMEGGTEQLMETAEMMRKELDTDFCNYMNFAIEQEEKKLRSIGLDPAISPKLRGPHHRLSSPSDAYDPSDASDASDPFDPFVGPDRSRAVSADTPVDKDEKSVRGQQWLLVLQLIRQGTYAMLAKDYGTDVQQIRYIIGLANEEARKELATRSLMEMSEEESAHFRETVSRICANLAVQRNAQDREMHQKVSELQAHVDSYFSRNSMGSQGQF